MSRSPGWGRPRTRGRPASWPAAVLRMATPGGSPGRPGQPRAIEGVGTFGAPVVGLVPLSQAEGHRPTRSVAIIGGWRGSRCWGGEADGRQLSQPTRDHPSDGADVGGGQGGQDRHHHQHSHPAQLRSPPAWVQLRGRRGAPTGRPHPHRAHPLVTNRRRPLRRAGRRLWVAVWWRACSAWAWAAVARHLLRQRHCRQRAWWGSQPRPRSSNRNGAAAAGLVWPPPAWATRRSATVDCRLMRHHHRPRLGRPGRGGGAGGPGRPPVAARPRPGPGGGGCGTRGRRPGYRAGSRGTAAGCVGADRTQRPT